jgi:serine protease Do
MRTSRIVAWAIIAAAVAGAPALGAADPVAQQVRQICDKVMPSTVIVSYYVQREDGSRPDLHLLGTVVGPGNLIMISSAAVPSSVPASQLKDFKVTVVRGDNLESYSAEYLGKDDEAQVAMLRVTDPKAPPLPVLAFDTGQPLGIGDAVLTFANLGEPDRYERVARLTRVAARIDQPMTTYLTGESLGSPGTPVVTLEGKAVGIVGLVRINRNTNARPEYATLQAVWPAERFIERIKNPPKGGTAVHHPWLGVSTLTPVTKDLADYFKLADRRGAVVGHVVEKGPADKAGLKAEDIILAIDGKDLKGTEGQLVENFTNDIRERKAGQTVTLAVWRGGKTQDIKVALEAEPKTAAEAERYRHAQVGLTVREMVVSDRLSRDLAASETGVVVAYVTPASWASDAGLKPEDIVKKMQDQDTPTLADFRKVFEAEARKKPKEIVLFVLRGKKDTQLVRIETRWAAAPEKPKTEPPAEKKPVGAGEAKPEAGT